MGYKYLVISALQEELDEFLSKMHPEVEQLEHDVILAKTNKIEILLFSADKMGMPYNAAKWMQIISYFKPTYVFLIGICAGLKDEQLGSVLIPKRIFSYESGKYENGKFLPDFISYETSDILRKRAQTFIKQNGDTLRYNVICNEDFCSGAAVINDESIVNEIKLKGSRKLSGLDMEAYSVACIDDISDSTNLLVVKSISDKAVNKDVTEIDGERDKAKLNSADFTFRFIKYLEENWPPKDFEYIQIDTRISYDEDATYDLKLNINVTNISSSVIVLESLFFRFDKPTLIHDKLSIERSKPKFLIGKDNLGKDLYRDICILKPGEITTGCWVPVNSTIGEINLNKLLKLKKIGIWKFKSYILSDEKSHIKNIAV